MSTIDPNPSFAILGSGHWPINLSARKRISTLMMREMILTSKPCSSPLVGARASWKTGSLSVLR